MKRVIKYFAAVLAAALLCLSLVACGGSTKKYNYKDTTVSGDTTGMFSAIATAFNAAYKDSSIEVGDGEIVWTYTGGEGKMAYTMDGDKYDLSGDMIDKLKEGIPGASGAAIELYGTETDEGFSIVESVTLAGVTLEIRLNFTKA